MHFQSETFVFNFVPRSLDAKALAVYDNIIPDHLLGCCKKTVMQILFIIYNQNFAFEVNEKSTCKASVNQHFSRNACKATY